MEGLFQNVNHQTDTATEEPVGITCTGAREVREKPLVQRSTHAVRIYSDTTVKQYCVSSLRIAHFLPNSYCFVKSPSIYLAMTMCKTELGTVGNTKEWVMKPFL